MAFLRRRRALMSPTRLCDSLVDFFHLSSTMPGLPATNESLRLVGGLFSPFFDDVGPSCHQRVFTTRWWSFFAFLQRHQAFLPPTSLYNSLVVFFCLSLKMPGRCGPSCHQRVFTTRWWSFFAFLRRRWAFLPPTSLYDSLVVSFRLFSMTLGLPVW